MSRPRLLALRALGLGDLLTGVPALRGLRAGFPQHHLVLAAPAWLGPLVQRVEAVDRHVAVEELAPLPDALAGVDVAVNLHGSGPESHRVLLEAAPRRLIAFRHDEVVRTRGGPPWSDDEHEVDRWCRLLADAGIPSDPTALAIDPPTDAAVPTAVAGATVIHPGAKSAARRWPAGRFGQVAASEVAAGRRVVVTGSVDERDLARAVADRAGLGDEAVLAGRTDLGGLAAVIRAAGRLVAGDTGVGHLATALGTPSVLLFGPTPPHLWGPPEHLRDRHRVLWRGRTGDPLADEPFPGLLEITVDDVRAELAELADPAASVPRSSAATDGSTT